MANKPITPSVSARAKHKVARPPRAETAPIRSEEEAHANCRRYKLRTRRFVFFMLSTKEAETCATMLHRLERLTPANAKCQSGELEQIAERLYNSNAKIPDDEVNNLELTIELRKLQGQYYTSRPDSCPVENGRHQHFVDVLISVYERITRRTWDDVPAVKSRTGNLKSGNISHAIVVPVHGLKKNTSVQSPSNRFSALANIEDDTAKGAWSCLKPLGSAQQLLLNLLQGEFTGTRTIHEVVICMNQGVRHLRTMGCQLHSQYPGLLTVRDIDDSTVLDKLWRFLSEESEEVRSDNKHRSTESLEEKILVFLQQYTLEMDLINLRGNQGFQAFLNLDTFYTEAKTAVEQKRVPNWFLWAVEPYFRLRNLLARPNSRFTMAISVHVHDIETSLAAVRDIRARSSEQDGKITPIADAITAARQLRANLALLGTSAYKYPVSVSLQSFSAMLSRHRAGLLRCSEGGPVGLLAFLYVAGVMFDLFPDDPSHEAGYINQWNDMETLFDSYGINFRARNNIPKPLKREDFASDDDYDAAEQDLEIEFRSRVGVEFLGRFPALELKTRSGVTDDHQELYPLNYLAHDMSQQCDISPDNLGPSFDGSVNLDGMEAFIELFGELYEDTCLNYLGFGIFCNQLIKVLCRSSDPKQSPWDVVANALAETASYEEATPMTQLPKDSKLVRAMEMLTEEKALEGDCMLVKARAWRDKMALGKLMAFTETKEETCER